MPEIASAVEEGDRRRLVHHQRLPARVDIAAVDRPQVARRGPAAVRLNAPQIGFNLPRRGCLGFGAKRPEQIRANAGGMGWRLSENQRDRIELAIARRGTVASRGAV